MVRGYIPGERGEVKALTLGKACVGRMVKVFTKDKWENVFLFQTYKICMKIDFRILFYYIVLDYLKV